MHIGSHSDQELREMVYSLNKFSKFNTLYSKMAAILVFFCVIANWPFWPRFQTQNSKEYFTLNEANLQSNKRILKWRPFWNKVYFTGIPEIIVFLVPLPLTNGLIGGFHVTSSSSSSCWWTKTKDLSLAPFVRPPAIVHCSIVINLCLQRLVANHLYLTQYLFPI